MPAIPFVPGPCPLWVALEGRGPLFLGFSESGVSLDITPHWSPYYNDLGGSTELDRSYQGASAGIHLDLTRWDPSTLFLLEQVAGGPGFDIAGDMGSLMVYEGFAATVWAVFPYVAKAAYARHMAGYRFPACVIDRDSLPQRGSKPAKVGLALTALRTLVMTQATQNAFGAGTLVLYDFDMTAIAGRLPD